jgi:hypothetical protein
MQELVKKKNQGAGFGSRWITLGHTQLLISKDKEVTKLVNFIPLQTANLVISKPPTYEGLNFIPHQD